MHIKAPHINDMQMRNHCSLFSPIGLVSRTVKASRRPRSSMSFTCLLVCANRTPTPSTGVPVKPSGQASQR